MAGILPVGSIPGIGGTGATGALNALGSSDPLSSTGSAGTSTLATGDAAAAGDAAPGDSFLSSLGAAFGSLNDQLVSADSAMASFAAGGSADLHTVLLQMQDASLGLKLGVQVRDKLLEAYQQIMQMQL